MSPPEPGAPRPWLAAYPSGLAADIDPACYATLVELIDAGLSQHAQRSAYRYCGHELRYAEVDAAARALAAWLQSLGLTKGERVALLLPNVPQYPIAAIAALRAGLVLVHLNPLCSARELEYQLCDSGAKLIVVLEHYAATLAACLSRTPLQQVLIATPGDCLPWPQAWLVNYAARHVKKGVPPFELPSALSFASVLRRGRQLPWQAPRLAGDDMALLQYSGGTTGVSKAAVLLQRNLVANVLQAQAWLAPALRGVAAHEPSTLVGALPLQHSLAFTVNLLLGWHSGARNILVPNPRDVQALLQALQGQAIHGLLAEGALFQALLEQPDFARVDCSRLQLALCSGTALPSALAQRWLERTGCPIALGYGLSETGALASCTPVSRSGFDASIGLPLPSTEMRCVDERGDPLPPGTPGEIEIRGPQLMAGYWRRPDETARVMNSAGWLRSGDIGVMERDGSFRLLERKQDVIVVRGCTVYPNAVEALLLQMGRVRECAVVGSDDADSGAALKLVLVKDDPTLSEQDVRDYWIERLSGYPCPQVIEFRAELPRNAAGQVLRRQLRQPK